MIRMRVQWKLMFFLLVVFWCRFAVAQSISVGAKGGAVLTNDMEYVTGGNSESKRYTFGPAFEFGLPWNMGIEASVLYRRVGYTSSQLLGDAYVRARSDWWEIPILAKYYLPLSIAPVQPFVSGGYALRRLSNTVRDSVFMNALRIENGQWIRETLRFHENWNLQNNPSHGIAFGGGLLFRSGRVRISPEIRYTRWLGGLPFDESGSRGFSVQSSRNQLNLMLALTFDVKKRGRN
jgi:hypothetical protein